MYKVFKIIALLLVFIMNQPLANQFSKQIDTLLKPWHSPTKPGIAVAVSKDNKMVYQKYYGTANLESLSAINSKTKFLIASVSKQFTAFAIALLQEKGQLSYQDDIHKYIPEFPKYGNKITIMHLLNHTSGLRDLDDLNGLIGIGLSDYVSFNDVYKLITQQKKLNFVPGLKHDYSNSGYVVLAKIVEKITGKSFREFMNETVFEPLEMKNTLVLDNPFEVIGNKATAYFSNDGQNYSTNNLFSSVYGSTGIYTTLADLNKWANNFTHPKVGNKHIFESMRTKGKLNNGSQINYGLGQEMKTYKGHEVVFHGGGQGAYRAYLLRFPELDLSISILSNSSYSTSFIIDYVYQIADIYLGKNSNTIELKDKPSSKYKEDSSTKFLPVKVNKSLLANYIGNYQIQPGLIFTIEQIEGNLQLRITGNDKAIPLEAKTANEFILMDSNNGYRLVFPKGTSSKIKSISYFQADFEYIGERVHLVEFDKENIKWKEFEGLYYSEELNTVYLMSYDGQNLIAHHAKNTPITLTPHQPDIFNGLATFFQEIKYLRNTSNEVSGMLVSGSRSKNINFVKLRGLSK